MENTLVVFPVLEVDNLCHACQRNQYQAAQLGRAAYRMSRRPGQCLRSGTKFDRGVPRQPLLGWGLLSVPPLLPLLLYLSHFLARSGGINSEAGISG